MAVRAGTRSVGILETQVQVDHVSELVAYADATAYLPGDAGVDFPHESLGGARWSNSSGLLRR